MRGIGDIVPLRSPRGVRYPAPAYPPGQAPGLFGPLSATAPLPYSPETLQQALMDGSPAFQQNPWLPTQVLPDSMLPIALKRRWPDRGPFWARNVFDARLLQEAYVWKFIAEHGGLKSCCKIPELGAPIWDQPPWEVMPSQGIKIQPMFSVTTASLLTGGVFDGLDHVIGQFRVPLGWDGAITNFVTQAVGVTGWDEFSGNIVWRLKIGNRYAKNLGNVINTYGSFTNALLVPFQSIRTISGQTVTVLVNVPVGAPIAGGRIAGGVFGWHHPHR